MTGVNHTRGMVETAGVSEARAFAVKIKDDLKVPLFSDGKMVFMNLDLEWRPATMRWPIVGAGTQRPSFSRWVKDISNYGVLHSPNRK